MLMDGMRAAMLLADGVTPDWYFPIRITLISLISVLAVFIILVVLLQPGNSEGMGSLGGGSSDTFLDKNKSRTSEGLLKRLTIITAVSLMVICVLFFITVAVYTGA